MNRRTAATKLALPIVLATCWTATASAEPVVLGGQKMLVHGNYCGYGNNAPLAPTDALDAACARHDTCTPDNDLPVKACNLRLEQEAQAIALDMRQVRHAITMAGFVAAYASTAPSRAAPVVVPVSVRAPVTRPAYTTLR